MAAVPTPTTLEEAYAKALGTAPTPLPVPAATALSYSAQQFRPAGDVISISQAPGRNLALELEEKRLGLEQERWQKQQALEQEKWAWQKQQAQDEKTARALQLAQSLRGARGGGGGGGYPATLQMYPGAGQAVMPRTRHYLPPTAYRTSQLMPGHWPGETRLPGIQGPVVYMDPRTTGHAMERLRSTYKRAGRQAPMMLMREGGQRFS